MSGESTTHNIVFLDKQKTCGCIDGGVYLMINDRYDNRLKNNQELNQNL